MDKSMDTSVSYDLYLKTTSLLQQLQLRVYATPNQSNPPTKKQKQSPIPNRSIWDLGSGIDRSSIRFDSVFTVGWMEDEDSTSLID